MLQRRDLATLEQRVARPHKEAGVDPVRADVTPVEPEAARTRARTREGLPRDQGLRRAQAGDDDGHRSVVEPHAQDGARTRLRGSKGADTAMAQAPYPGTAQAPLRCSPGAGKANKSCHFSTCVRASAQ